ncbi:MAG: type II secretion system protein [Phycisphaerales bacterium]|nr:type II secretion system protein [Phycisphaerales bacterium]
MRSSSGTGGFTLIEILVTIAVIAVLLSLSAPALHKIRARAMAAATLSNVRQSAQVLTAYTADWRGSFPAFLDPRADSWKLEIKAQGITMDIDRYFLAGMLWHLALADMYYDGRTDSESVYSAEQLSRDGPGGMPFMLPCAFFAEPLFWNQRTRTGPGQYRGTRQDQVVYPSDKSLLICADPLMVRDGDPRETLSIRHVPMAAVDGSAADHAEDNFAPGVSSGEGVFDQSVHVFDLFVGLHTVEGVRGRDIR